MRSKKLTQAFDDFTAKMKKRLNHKEREGFTGWDYKALSSDFTERAIGKLRNPLADEKDFVDVANLAMFLAHIKGEREMTNEDKKIVADYMNWPASGNDMRHEMFDLNDASLCVKEMQKRGEWAMFYDDLLDTYNGLCEDGKVIYGAENFAAWLFNSDNFFNAMSEWLKERGK